MRNFNLLAPNELSLEVKNYMTISSIVSHAEYSSKVNQDLAEFAYLVLDFSQVLYDNGGLDFAAGTTIEIVEMNLITSCTGFTSSSSSSSSSSQNPPTSSSTGGISTSSSSQPNITTSEGDVVVLDEEYKSKFRTAVALYFIFMLIILGATVFMVIKILKSRKAAEESTTARNHLQKQIDDKKKLLDEIQAQVIQDEEEWNKERDQIRQ